MTSKTKSIFARVLLASVSSCVFHAAPGFAQDAVVGAELTPEEASVSSGDIVVTGSRIRQSATDTPAPIVALDSQYLADRGFTSAAQTLNTLTANVPSLNVSPNSGQAVGSGQQFPNLFNLGAGRTLTLVNGRRMATTASGLGDSSVDSNIIPIGLLKRVDVVQAGGAAVYGSDAIAGVINYVLRDDFEGVELHAQAGVSSRGDYFERSLRGTFGTNFGGGRGNIAVSVDYSRTPTLDPLDRPFTARAFVATPNAANVSTTDGRPPTIYINDARFWTNNYNGVIFTTPAPAVSALTRLGGSALQFSPDGASVVPYNVGAVTGIPFAVGGDGQRYTDLTLLQAGVERLAVNAIGHYDLTESVKVRAEGLFARTRGTDRGQTESRFVLGTVASNSGAIPFTINNPYLTSAARATLASASPAFAAGGTLYSSKNFRDLTISPETIYTTKTYRALLGLEGDFNIGERNFYWSVSGSYARVEGETSGWATDRNKSAKAFSAATNAAGQIVCAVNADAITNNDDPACVPVNPFGDGNVSQAAREYLSVRSGSSYVNQQQDYLATLGGSLVKLPGGDLGFSVAYEHRQEKVRFDPFQANLLGLTGSGVPQVRQRGAYNTDEFSGELAIPVFGGDFTLPLVEKLDLRAAFRHVDNSTAGRENVWDLGARWQLSQDIALRVSRSRNFRAPTLTQLFAPSSTGPAVIMQDPCDADRINGGSNPATRQARCLALFQANPSYGTGGAGSPAAGSSAQVRLAAFQDPAENFARAVVTSGGNPNLANEISDTFTYGIVLQPRFIPGLTITADRIEIDLKDGLSAFATMDFAAVCFDDPNPPAAVCNAFSRLATGDGTNPAGTIITGTTTTFNAGVVRFRGEVYNINYTTPLNAIFGGGDLGTLTLNAEATHTTVNETSVTGTTFVRRQNTVQAPSWVGRLDVTYAKGPWRLSYQAQYRDSALFEQGATIETRPVPVVKGNTIHSLSGQVETGPMTFQLGVTNFTDKQPSFPLTSYGDILGRRFFAGVKVRY